MQGILHVHSHVLGLAIGTQGGWRHVGRPLRKLSRQSRRDLGKRLQEIQDNMVCCWGPPITHIQELGGFLKSHLKGALQETTVNALFNTGLTILLAFISIYVRKSESSSCSRTELAISV